MDNGCVLIHIYLICTRIRADQAVIRANVQLCYFSSHLNREPNKNFHLTKQPSADALQGSVIPSMN